MFSFFSLINLIRRADKSKCIFPFTKWHKIDSLLDNSRVRAINMLIVANSNSCSFNFHDTNIHNLRRERVINYWIPRWLTEYFYWLLCRWWNRNLHQAGLMMLMIEITCFNMIDMIIINWDIIRNKRNSKAFIISAYTITWKFFFKSKFYNSV